mmetsp:Transcript_46669/g.73058  ORF Transcript_46669/g.73058 Transcript_46669/m.73058 type:complete len:245 (+) Transcript_46669:44-778(+)
MEGGNNQSVVGMSMHTDTIVLRISRSEMRRNSNESAESAEGVSRNAPSPEIGLLTDETRRRLGDYLQTKGLSPEPSPSPTSAKNFDISPMPRRRSRETSRTPVSMPRTPESRPGTPEAPDILGDDFETDTEDNLLEELDLSPRMGEKRKEARSCRHGRHNNRRDEHVNVPRSRSFENLCLGGDEPRKRLGPPGSQHHHNFMLQSGRNAPGQTRSMPRRGLPPPIVTSDQDVAEMMQGITGLGQI